jgi:Protein of unknown function (DUF5672)
MRASMTLRLPLQQVTLVAVETQLPVLAAEALLRSMAQVDFARVLLFAHEWVPPRVIRGLEVVDIPPLPTPSDRSYFVLRQLPAHIRTSHALLVQWDGFVTNPEAWGPEFLTFDYLGAPWPGLPEGRNVGSGGFSLRSRHLLVAGQNPRWPEWHPDDEVLCHSHREALERERGVHFAPSDIAQRFAAGAQMQRRPSFGFHGAHHLARVLDEPTLQRWLGLLPDEFFLGADARRLARALLLHRRPALLRQLLERRKAAGEMDTESRLLGTATSIMGLLGPRTA